MQKLRISDATVLIYEGSNESRYPLNTNMAGGLRVSILEVLGKHLVKKLVRDVTITFFVIGGHGKFIINGFKHVASKDMLFVINSGDTFTYSGNMKVVKHVFSPSNEFSVEFVNPPKALADFSWKAGLAVVYAQDGVYLLNVNSMNKPEPAGNTNINMWMPDLGDVVRGVKAGVYPFKRIYKKLAAGCEK